MSKKIVVKLDLHDNKDKQKAMKAVSVLVGIDAVSIDMVSRKMTVIGTVDPVDVASKLRKLWVAYIESVGPEEEPEKKEEEPENKEEKEEGKEGKKEGDSKKEGDNKKEEEDGKKEGGDGTKEEGDGKKEGGDDTKEEEGGKKEDDENKEGDGKKEGEDKKDEAADKKEEGVGGDQKEPATVAPLPLPQLPPPYMINTNYMHQYRPPPPPVYPYVPPPQYYYARNMSMEENPNSCAIC